MRRLHYVTLAACLIGLWSAAAVDAGPPRGRGARGLERRGVSEGRRILHPAKPFRADGHSTHELHRRVPGRVTTIERDVSPRGIHGEELTGRHHAFATQRRNEERILQHRLDTAQQLRDISQRNGNERLLEAADRMEQKAFEHYQRRTQRIEELENRFGLGETEPAGTIGPEADHHVAAGSPIEPHPSADSVSDHHSPAHSRPGDHFRSVDGVEHGYENPALERQLFNEQRNLEHRLRTAEQLREIAQRNGNGRLLETADRMEQQALEHYERRIERIEEMQERLAESELHEHVPTETGELRAHPVRGERPFERRVPGFFRDLGRAFGRLGGWAD